MTFQPRPGALYERSRATLPARSRDSHIRGAVVSFCWFVMHVRTGARWDVPCYIQTQIREGGAASQQDMTP